MRIPLLRWSRSRWRRVGEQARRWLRQPGRRGGYGVRQADPLLDGQRLAADDQRPVGQRRRARRAGRARPPGSSSGRRRWSGRSASTSGSKTTHGARRLARAASRRSARARRSRRAARRRGARRGCRSRRRARRRAAARASMRLTTSTPKPSSPRKMLPMPATRTVHRATTSISSGWKYEEPALPLEDVGSPGRRRASRRRAGRRRRRGRRPSRSPAAGEEQVVGVGPPRRARGARGCLCRPRRRRSASCR